MIRPGVFDGRVALQQRVLPEYRVAFVEHLARSCAGGLSVFAGGPRPSEGIESAEALEGADWTRARNLHLLGGPVYACVQKGLVRWLEAWNPDVLIVEASARNVLNSWAREWMHRRSRPVIGWGLGAPPPTGALGFLRKGVRRQFLQGFDALIAYSTRGAETYCAEGLPADRVFVAVNAVWPAPRVTGEHRPAPTARVPRVLFVGRLQARKRVDMLLHACAGVIPEAEVWIVGDGPARPALEALGSRVCPGARFLGARHGLALSEVFEQVDLFVLPGTGGLAVHEAMAHGLAVVVGEGDGSQRDLVRTENGWLLREGSEAELRRVLMEALSDRNRLRAMGEESRRIVIEEVNVEAMVRAFVQALHRVVGQEA
jgi:glycosyltransferase involved in cell wall biosynthesis